MAKKKLSFSFSKGVIGKDNNGKFTFTEIVKDEENLFNLQSTLESLIGIEGVSINISTEDSILKVEDDEL